MKEGCIVWDAINERPDIRYWDNTYYGGLHCRDTLEAFIGGMWQPMRVECDSTGMWYLYGPKNFYEILWLIVRH